MHKGMSGTALGTLARESVECVRFMAPSGGPHILDAEVDIDGVAETNV